MRPRAWLAVILAAACSELSSTGGADAGGSGPSDSSDASDASDASEPFDASTPEPCSAGGVPGNCMEAALCTGSRTPAPDARCTGEPLVQCCTPALAVSCDPNAQPQPNLGLLEEPGEGGCPDGMVRVSTFCIDRFEASLQALSSGAPSPYHPPPASRVRAVSLRGAVPQGYVSQTQAAAACAEVGKRLCTDAEWLRACQGPAPTTYPYGETYQQGACNDRRATHPAVELYGTTDTWIWSHLDSPCLNQLQPGLARTGAFSGCATPEGVFDLVGNLHEWTADPAGTFRGGYYVEAATNGAGCLYRTSAHDVAYWDYSTGFRCCAD